MSSPLSSLDGVGAIYKKIWLGMSGRSRSVHKPHVHQPPANWGGERVNLLKTFCARNCIKCPVIYRKGIFVNCLPHGIQEGVGG